MLKQQIQTGKLEKGEIHRAGRMPPGLERQARAFQGVELRSKGKEEQSVSGNQTECVPDQWETKHGRRGEWVTGGPGSCMVHGEVTGLGRGK